MFYGLPIHIMRDLFMTAKSFVNRLGALMRYRKALQGMKKLPDATEEDLAREDTCIICREQMRPWNPDAGAVERTRPKKLPCGHILHFGCLRSWLERQQVCPTCRRPVIITIPAANGDAQGARANGQAQGQQGQQHPPDNRPGNAGRPAQGGRGVANMRVWQFGPLRLGIAQGNPQNINIEEMAQRLRQPLDAAGNPTAPIVPPAPQPAQAIPGGDTNNASGNNFSDIHTQLQDISQRIQQEMLALHASQQELRTLYALTAELDRLRQLQQQPHAQGVPLTAQPGQGVPQQPLPPPFPTNFTAPFTQPNPLGFNTPIHPSAAAFPNLPPRFYSPTISRYGGASNTTAIPAGSADLPEGVTIPDGWTLLPLQRLDDSSRETPSGTQQTAVSFDMSPTRTVPSSSNERPTPADAAVGARAFNVGPSANNTDEPTSTRRETSEPMIPAPSSSQVEEPPAVAAPTPVMPNWGGAAQLFPGASASADNLRNEEAREGADGPTPSGSGSRNDSAEDRGVETSSSGESGDSKGKARAVTVEDADDDDDDDDKAGDEG